MEDDDMAREPEVITELRRSLGTQLATFRMAAELTQGELAKVAICDRTTLVHIEKGRARADERFWRTVDAACNAEGILLAAYLELEAAKAEYESREREQRLANVRAKAAELRGHSDVAAQARPSNADPVNVPQLEGLRRAILGFQPDDEPLKKTTTLPQLEATIWQAHKLYQSANYDAAAQLLPLVIRRVEEPASLKVPLHTKAAAYLAAAKLATKMGHHSLSWVAADRSLRLASESDRPGLIGVANYQVACALLRTGHIADAEQAAAVAAEDIDSRAPSIQSRIEDVISAQGALLLLLAVTAARRGDSQTAKNNLRNAGKLAERLGQDDNRLWTAFGPTNIAIHELSVQVALGDSQTALQLGQRIDTDSLPAVLRGRRSQVHLELSWASVGQGDDSLAVLHLLEAERVAKQAVSRNVKARSLLTTLMSRESKSATPGLRALAARAGVI
jgi:DNA-binding XRE family transcriptional regulator